MPYKVKPSHSRRLWLRIRVRIGDGEQPRSAKEVWQTLIYAIHKGNYKYPDGWYVEIQWRNREDARMRTGEFEAEMLLSKRSSNGFDKAVLNYLKDRL